MLKRNQQGQILFEFILILPLALMVLFGMVEAGWYFYNRIAVANASVTGADYAVGLSISDPEHIRWRVRQAAGAVGLEPEEIGVEILYREGQPVIAAVGISHRYRPIVGSILFRRSMLIRSESIRYYPIQLSAASP